MKKKRAQQSAWRRHIDRDIAHASLAHRNARAAGHRLALTPQLTPHIATAAVAADTSCPPISNNPLP